METGERIPRRAFLAGGAAYALAASAGEGRKHSAFEKVTLGKTGIVTTRLGFGTGASSWNRTSAIVRKNGEDGAARLVRDTPTTAACGSSTWRTPTARTRSCARP